MKETLNKIRKSRFVTTLLGRLPKDHDELRAGLPLEQIQDMINPMMDFMLDRSYLEDVSSSEHFIAPGMELPGLTVWVRLDRLPMKSNAEVSDDLFRRWQGVLSTFHAWNCKIIFNLQRKDGDTAIYLGVCSPRGEDAVRGQIQTALENGMPGTQFTMMADDAIADFHDRLSECGAVTGIPSLRKGGTFVQTLDQLAFGIKDQYGKDVDFSVMVVAEPICDLQITDAISRFLKCGSDIHTEVLRRVSDSSGRSAGASTTVGLGIGALLQTLGVVTANPLLFTCGHLWGATLSRNNSSNEGISVSHSVTKEYLNKFAQHSEKLTDKHAERLRRGRNLGFWNTGVYVMAPTGDDVRAVTGMLRSVYSGDESYIEPIRLHLFNSASGADNYIRSARLIPLKHDIPNEEVPDEWHMFGSMYQYVSTPMNTEELSIATSLPQRDVPGLRFTRNAVRFANNPGEGEAEEGLMLGNIKDTGVVRDKSYYINVNSLTRHALITGMPGGGKSTTARKIINEVDRLDIPFLIIEPAKDEYVHWAIERNRRGGHRKINVFMPGEKMVDGVRIEQLKLNPFEPAGIEGAQIDMLTRCEQLIAVVNASLPTADVLPVLIDESFYQLLMEQPYGDDILQGRMAPRGQYPKIGDALEVARRQLASRGYDQRTTNSLAAALETRFKYLARGRRAEVLNVMKSTPWERIFGEPTVINLSRIGNSADRALMMAILVLGLYEYNVSRFENDAEFRAAQTRKNTLAHLTVLEEAHNVLARPHEVASGSGNPQQIVADLFTNILSEIRSYGEGVMIVDQVPSRLIPDAIDNTGYKIVHRLTSPANRDAMASALALRDDQKGVITTLEPGDAIVLGERDDAASWVKVQKP